MANKVNSYNRNEQLNVTSEQIFPQECEIRREFL